MFESVVSVTGIFGVHCYLLAIC